MIATYRGICEHTDPSGVTDAGRVEWEKHLKADHPHPTYRHGDPVVKVFKRPAVTLSKVEKEWLGQYVTVLGWGQQVWQVWAMAPADVRQQVWLVRDGEAVKAPLIDLTLRASASEYEDVAFNFEMDDAA